MTDRRKRWSARFSTRFGAIPYRYALTPFVWDTTGPHDPPHWRFPDTTQGGIDLRPLPAQAIAGGAPQGLAFVSATQPVSGSEITRAMYVDASATTAMRDAWQANMGYRPAGDQLRDLLWDQLTTGADPTGDAGPKPLMPTTNGQLELLLGGHSLIKREPFRWGHHPHTNRVQAVLQRDFEKMWEETNGDDQCRRVLDYYCEQYRIGDWHEFVPQRLRAHVPGRLPHATTYTDDFNRANGSLDGGNWTEVLGNSSILSNQVVTETGGLTGRNRYQSDLSSANHYSQIVGHSWITDENFGPLCRFSSSDETHYFFMLRNNTSFLYRVYKVVSGIATLLAGPVTGTVPSVPITAKLSVDGSSLTCYQPAVTSVVSVTDTAITGNLRAGFNLGALSAASVTVDDWEAADLAAAGHPAMRRWGMSRGGIYRPVEIGRQGAQVI